MILYNITLYDTEGKIIGPIEFFYFNNIFIIMKVSIITNQIYDLLNVISKEMNNDLEIKFTHKYNLLLLKNFNLLYVEMVRIRTQIKVQNLHREILFGPFNS